MGNHAVVIAGGGPTGLMLAAERFLAQGKTMQIISFAAPIDISDFPTRHGYVLALPQVQIERLLAAWVAELGAITYRGCEVNGFTQDDSGVDVTLSDDDRTDRGLTDALTRWFGPA